MALQRKPPKRGEKPIEHRRPLGRLRLHLDDLDDVHALLKERTKSVSLTAGNAIADTPDDLRDATRRELGQVRFVTSNPDVVVALTYGVAVARTSDDSVEAIEIIEDIQALLESRRRNLYSMFIVALQAVTLVAAAMGLLILLILGITVVVDGWQGATEAIRNTRNPPAVAYATLAGASVLTIKGLIATRNTARIVPERRGSARRFTAQTTQAWLIGISGVVLTALITALITYSLTK